MSTHKKRQSKYPPYAQARSQALELQLNSRQAYIKWHTDSKCQYLPRYPERVYKQWVSWNDWLGTANVFKGDLTQLPPVRPFWEAVKWSQQFAMDANINTMADWIVYCRDHGNELPDDIPHHPDNRYDEFKTIGWKGWLGTDVRGRLAAAKQDVGLFAIFSYQSPAKPGNVYVCVHAEAGMAELVQYIQRHEGLRCVRVWKVIGEGKENVHQILLAHGRQDDGGWFIPAISNLVFDIDMVLEPWHGDLAKPEANYNVSLEWNGMTPTWKPSKLS